MAELDLVLVAPNEGQGSARTIPEDLLVALSAAVGGHTVIQTYSDPSFVRIQGAKRSADAVNTVMQLCDQAHIDYGFLKPGSTLRDFKVLAMDMDSTLITIECVDEIADYAQKKSEVAAITAAAMRGEIKDYDESLRRRVALLAGLSESALQAVYDERLQLTQGAEALVSAAHAMGIKTLLVSGGFTFFTDRLKQRLSLTETRSNVLGIENGVLTGQVLGEIVNAHVKRRTVEETCEHWGLSHQEVIAIGDGANDLEMMSIAGLSVAHHAKPVVRQQVDVSLSFSGFETLLRMLS